MTYAASWEGAGHILLIGHRLDAIKAHCNFGFLQNVEDETCGTRGSPSQEEMGTLVPCSGEPSKGCELNTLGCEFLPPAPSQLLRFLFTLLPLSFTLAT